MKNLNKKIINNQHIVMTNTIVNTISIGIVMFLFWLIYAMSIMVHGAINGINIIAFVSNLTLGILGFVLTIINIKNSHTFKHFKPIKIINIMTSIFYVIVIFFAIIYYLSIFGVLIPLVSQLGGVYAFLPICIINIAMFVSQIICLILICNKSTKKNP